MKIEIIGLIGVIGSGKTYLSNTYKNQGFQELSFAQSCKDLLWEVLQWKPVSQEEENKFKDEYEICIKNKNDSYNISGRNLIINFSERIKENVSKSIWADLLITKIKKGIINDYNKFIISDVRFFNEVLALKNFYDYRRIDHRDQIELKFIFCNYKSDRYSIIDDKSEHLAQKMLKKGYEHLDVIPLEHLY